MQLTLKKGDHGTYINALITSGLGLQREVRKARSKKHPELKAVSQESVWYRLCSGKLGKFEDAAKAGLEEDADGTDRNWRSFAN